LTIQKRNTGWLSPNFHNRWQHILLHACSRYSLLCPDYVLMPDHMHLLWLGLDPQGSDQRSAVSFLRKQLRTSLHPTEWQHQPHDNVLRDADRGQGAFQRVAQYILENPVRKGLTGSPAEYRYLGCCVPGYPDLHVIELGYWPLFWRIYNRLIERSPPLAHARSYKPKP
jgi:REP element-mobilizing transposase RayT